MGSPERKTEADANSHVPLDTALFYVQSVRYLAGESDATASVVAQWRLFEEWLGCAGRVLNAEDHSKILQTWRSYLASGNSPSSAMEPIFSYYAALARTESWAVTDVPPAIADAFDRLLATDSEIESKNQFERVKRTVQGIKQARSSGGSPHLQRVAGTGR